MQTPTTHPWVFIPGPDGSFRIESPGAGVAGGTLVLAMRSPVYSIPQATMHAAGRLMCAAPRLQAVLQRLCAADVTRAAFAVHGGDAGTMVDYAAALEDARALLAALQPSGVVA
jgi:hypothetical protein